MTEQTHNSQFTIHNSQLENPNIAWAQLFVQALAQSGLTAVCIAPGSRSTPLTLAFEAQPEIEVYLHLDERSAGFFALGMAIASDKPVALVCTSGTAVANFLPAIIEANMSQVPLLILTADRPHELRHSGANQTIDQVKIFGDQVLWSVDLPIPQKDAPEVALRNLQALAHRAYATAVGLRQGPVHLNFPFRKPLEPEDSIRYSVISNRLPVTDYRLPITNGFVSLTEQQMANLVSLIQNRQRGLIVCGPRCPAGEFPQAVAALSRHLGFPILADPVSGVRFGEWLADTAVGSGYETFFQADPGWPEPEIIIRFGAVPISKWLNDYLDNIQPAVRIHIRENGVWADDSHRVTHFIQVNETAVCQTLRQKLPQQTNDAWLTAVTQTENKTWQMLADNLFDDYFDGAVVADVLEMIPAEATLLMGNSLPIRHLDQYGRGQSKPLFTYANRGASGIDGNLSTAFGIHTVRQKPLVAVVGDITFYHDMNALLAVRQLAEQNITVVVINNDGGGIFNRLPVAKIEPPFRKLFLTPHGLNFEPVARMFGWEYELVDGREPFKQTLAASLKDNTPRVIEVVTDNQHDDGRRRELNKIVLGALGKDDE